MLTGEALKAFRRLTLGGDAAPGFTEAQLRSLAAYRDGPRDPSDEESPGCERCEPPRDEVLCNISAERLVSSGEAWSPGSIVILTDEDWTAVERALDG